MALEKERVWFFEIRRICFFSFLYFLFLVTFLLYVTFFFSLFLFVVLFLLYSFFISLKMLHFIPFRVYYILLKQKSKQNAKQTSKQNRNRVANVADIILSYTLIGYKFAVSLFASVLLQLLLKQIRKQNPSKRISKSNDVVSQSTLHNLSTCFMSFFVIIFSVNRLNSDGWQ